MAALAKNWYLREVEAGRLELPDYEEDTNDCLYFYYGEMFCRILDCSKAMHNYKSINNLCTHVSSHKDVSLPSGNVGGRVPQELVDEAASNSSSTSTGGIAASPGSTTGTMPLLPKKKDGSVHVTNMRTKVARMGKSMPYMSCSSYINCCKDINKYNYFVLFNCSDLHPRAATKKAENQVEEIEEEIEEETV
ncbi:uncharacterized protein BJX67DRAFT_376062 [Aspergillus lucknowensis]|uniref:C2H2-type domain-containing protein n=1 Tax=Aspergillus lucknowensis TaxID=176173 RepID=A0ABR4L3N0_9EURO